MTPLAQYVLQAFVTLAGIAVLAALLLYANRRWGAVHTPGPMQLVGRLHLDGRRCVYLLRVGDRVFVFAATDHHLCKLADLKLSDLNQQELGIDPKQTRVGFAEVLERVFKAKADTSSNVTDSVELEGPTKDSGATGNTGPTGGSAKHS